MLFKLVCHQASHKYVKGQIVTDQAEIAEILAGDVARRFQKVALTADEEAALTLAPAPIADKSSES